jgi:hypothetical protein
MKCAVHPEIDAAGFCRNCGKPLCPQCAREVRGALYCEQCLANMMAAPQAVAGAAHFAPPSAASFAPPAAAPTYVYAAPVEHQGPNPGTACALGFIPGLGAVYNGEYVKGLIHVIIFGGIIAALNSDATPGGLQAMLGIFLGVFYCYMPIEAYRTARAKRMGLPVTGFFGEAAAPVSPPTEGATSAQPAHAQRNYTGSIVIIVIGVICLLATTDILNSRWIEYLWPLVIVAVGVALLLKRRVVT